MSRWPLLCVALLLGACGSNTPEIPPELLGGGAGDAGAGYPPGPYSQTLGGTVDNLKFRGWLDPKAAGYAPDALEEVQLAQLFADPGARLLVLNTAALWCQNCKIEHRELPSHLSVLKPRGLRWLTAIAEDASRSAAKPSHLAAWGTEFKSDHPLVLDPEYSLGGSDRAALAPLNLIVDPKTMRVLRVFEGNQASVMWPYIEAELDARQ